jgi:dienelactone hydrolase
MRNIYLLLILLVTTTCNSNPANKRFTEFAKKVSIGSINKNVACEANIQQSYALYLPSGYNPDTKYPIVFCFDPHGDGSLPVNLLKDDAERFKIVLVGSNNIQNGMSQDVILQLVNTLMNEVQANVNINDRKIYLMGFSGGARVAFSVLNQHSNIRGIIACSGSIPASYIPQQIYIAGIAGTDDMNYAEMVAMEQGFSQEANRHILLTFSGTHGWPPKTTISTAIQWLSIGEMKDNIAPINKETIDQFVHSQYNDSISLIEKHKGCKQIISTLNGLIDISLYQQKLENLEADSKLQKEMYMEARLDSIERARQELYKQAFNSKPIEWWSDEIARLQKSTTNSKSKTEADLNKRLLAYISLYAFSASNYAKRTSDLQAFPRYLKIYGLADPQNPDYYYFMASYFALTGKKEQTLLALEKAIQFGFTDMQKIKGDALFTNIVNDDSFIKLTNKINQKK